MAGTISVVQMEADMSCIYEREQEAFSYLMMLLFR